MFLKEQDLQITDVVWNFFDAVRTKWPRGWDSTGRGMMLNKTNGFRALMRLLRPIYLNLTAPGGIPKMSEFKSLLDRTNLNDDHFTTDEYKPSTIGESKLYHALLEKIGLQQ